MGKKKSKSRVKGGSDATMMEALGMSRVSQFFENERLRFFVGLLLFAISCCMVLAFISFFTTGQNDMSIIENLREGDMANQNGEFQNACGSMGARVAYFFVKRGFGIPALLIAVFLLLVSLRLLKAFKPQLLKWFMCLMLVMAWASIALAMFVSPLFPDSHFCLGGDSGLMAARWIEGLVGVPGLVGVLVVIALLFLTYVSSQTYEWVRKMLNPKKIFEKVPFTVEAPDGDAGNKADEEGADRVPIVEDPSTFDNPEEQSVIFTGKDLEVPVTDGENTEKPKPVRKKKSGTDDGMEVTVGQEEEKADGVELVSVGEKMLETYYPKRDLETYH